MSQPINSEEQRIRRAKQHVMKIKGVVGVAVGEKEGERIIKVYIQDPDVKLPENVEGFPVEGIHTGPIVAF